MVGGSTHVLVILAFIIKYVKQIIRNRMISSVHRLYLHSCLPSTGLEFQTWLLSMAG